MSRFRDRRLGWSAEMETMMTTKEPGQVAYEARFPDDYRAKGYAHEWAVLEDHAKVAWATVEDAVIKAHRQRLVDQRLNDPTLYGELRGRLQALSSEFNGPCADACTEAAEALADLENEEAGLQALVERQGKLLTDTVNVLRGPPPENTLWSHHDVAELARALKDRVDPSMTFQIGEAVMKIDGAYGGPGVVRASFRVDGKERVIVAHRIEGGRGELLHIYGARQLKRAADVEQDRVNLMAVRYAVAEASMGSDADEAAYREALRNGDTARIHELNDEAELRAHRAMEYLKDSRGHT